MKDNSHYRNYYEQGITRAASDWCIGINYTRALSLLASRTGNRVQLAQGRCLGAIVSFIFDRYKAQKDFVESTFYNVGLRFTKDSEEIKLIIKDLRFNENERDLAEKKLIELTTRKVYVSNIEVNKYPGKLFSLDELQNKMGKNYKMSNQETLTYAQKLYEQGYLTYPRSNTQYLASNKVNKITSIIEAVRKGFSIKDDAIAIKVSKSIFDDSKIESHSAITPTTKIPDLTKLCEEEKSLYMTVLNRFLANFCTERCLLEETKVTLSIGNNVAELKGIVIKQEGFLKYVIFSEKIMPKFIMGELLNSNCYLHEGKTQPPKNVSIQELNNFLKHPFKKIVKEDNNASGINDENIGSEDDTEDYKNLLDGLEIGTVATRADILENAKKYNYISEKKGYFQIEEKGIYFIETAGKLGLIMTTEQTATMGKYLKAVFNNKLTSAQVIGVIQKEVDTKVDKAKLINIEGFTSEKESIGDCPLCKKPIYENQKSFYCSGYASDPKCNFSLWKKDKFLTDRGKSLTKSLAKSLIKSGKANVKGLKKKDGTTYDTTITYKQNDNYFNVSFDGSTAVGSCPRCNRDILESSKAFYCSGYLTEPKCTYAIWKNNKFFIDRGIDVTINLVKELLEKGSAGIDRNDSTKTYKGIVSTVDTGTYINFKIDNYIN